MLKRILSVMLILVLSVFCATAAFADTALLFDEPDILTAEAEAELAAKLEGINERLGLDVAVAVVAEAVGDISDQAYSYYKDAGYGDNGVLLMFCTETRQAHIYTVGEGNEALGEAGRNFIFDEITYEMGEDDFAAAFGEFADLTDELIGRARAGDPYKEPFGFGLALVISLGIGFIVAFIVTGSMKGQLKTVRAQSAAANYQRAGSMAIVNATEFFLYSKVDRVRKESQSSSSSSGGSGGTTRQF